MCVNIHATISRTISGQKAHPVGTITHLEIFSRRPAALSARRKKVRSSSNATIDTKELLATTGVVVTGDEELEGGETLLDTRGVKVVPDVRGGTAGLGPRRGAIDDRG